MIRKNNMRTSLTLAVCGCCLGSLLWGCETSSHTTVRTFEYTNEPVPTQEPVHTTSGEYQMESQGQMIVDPNGGQ